MKIEYIIAFFFNFFLSNSYSFIVYFLELNFNINLYIGKIINKQSKVAKINFLVKSGDIKFKIFFQYY